jgi:uncharacterized protein
MKVVVTGAHGLVGSALCAFLSARQHQVIKLSRRKGSEGELYWNPELGQIDASGLEAVDAVVHLAGESVAQRWTSEARARIMESRQKGTRLLAETLAALTVPPKVFVSASAIGIYGVRGAEALSEESPAGQGFLAEVCKVWEQESEVAAARGIRTVKLRIGMVLSKKGGALAKMLPPFALGLGGVLGDGRQYMSWISLTDLVEAIHFILNDVNLAGPVNAVSPLPVTNAEFTAALGRALCRPTIFPVPAFGAKFLFGQMAEELLLAGAKVMPAKLTAAGFKFQHGDIDKALKHELA